MNQFIRFPPLGDFSSRSWRIYALVTPWLTILIGQLIQGNDHWPNEWLLTGTTLLTGLLLTVAFFCQYWITEKIKQRYPRRDQTMSRSVLVLLTTSLLSALLLAAVAGLHRQFRLFEATDLHELLLIIYLINLVVVVLWLFVYETVYSLSQWQQYQIDKEKLKRENLMARLQCLKNQVSPHFLFNSLNSLSSLIAEEPQRAEQFVDQMARVYRYMLKTNRQSDSGLVPGNAKTANSDDGLTTLDAELSFIESYYHLLKTRYGTGLNLTVQVADQHRQYRLPPLTLQLLVENAVKHNIILASRPLYIEIKTSDDGYLRVRNNLQSKTTSASRVALPTIDEQDSTRVGLANIRTQYALMTKKEPSIEAGPDYFTVTLPLFSKSLLYCYECPDR